MMTVIGVLAVIATLGIVFMKKDVLKRGGSGDDSDDYASDDE